MGGDKEVRDICGPHKDEVTHPWALWKTGDNWVLSLLSLNSILCSDPLQCLSAFLWSVSDLVLL